MTAKEKGPTKLATSSIFLSVLAFVFLLLTIPYYLSNFSDQRAANLSATYLVDDTFNISIDQAIEIDASRWLDVDTFNFGLLSKPHWLKIHLPVASSEERRLFLVDYGLLDKLDVWFLSHPSERNQYQSQVLAAYSVGDSYPYENRVFKHEQFLFPVPFDHEPLLVLIRTQTKGPVKVPLELWNESDFIEYSGLNKIFMGIFFGFMIAMSISNLFIYASTRNRLFAYYTGYVSCIALVVASLNAFSFHYLWPNNLWLQEFSVAIFANFTLIFIIALTIKLLDLSANVPRIYTLLRSLQYIYAILLVLCLFVPYELMIRTVLILLIISTPLILCSGIWLAIKGSLVAKYFCAAWAVLLFSGVSIAFENLGVYESPFDSIYLIIVGAIAESVLLALALAINFSNQLKSARESREAALKNEQEAINAKEKLIELQEKNQADLEYSIEERTLELEIALRELAEKNKDLERLSAIDPLTGLFNRRYFDKRLLAEARRSRRELTPLGIAMLDIDHFKKVNDTYGHLCGDYCLKVFADLLKEHIKRPSDVVCRYGGEEFVVILPNTDEAGLRKLLEKVRMSLANKKVMFEGNEIQLRVSIGACSRTVASEDEHVLLVAFVDKQLYAAKSNGRNRVVIESF